MSHETAVKSLDDFKNKALGGNMVSEMRMANNTNLLNLIEYLKCFSVLRLHHDFPSSRPLISVKIIAQGLVDFHGKPWNPNVRIHHENVMIIRDMALSYKSGMRSKKTQ